MGLLLQAFSWIVRSVDFNVETYWSQATESSPGVGMLVLL